MVVVIETVIVIVINITVVIQVIVMKGCRVQGIRFRVQGGVRAVLEGSCGLRLSIKVQDLGSRVWGLGFRVWG